MQRPGGPDGRLSMVDVLSLSVPGNPGPPPHSQQPPSGTETRQRHDSRSETSRSITWSDSVAYLAQLPAAERSQMQRAPRMDPYLQFMVGPLLRYDTVDENGLWYGAVLIVSACAADSAIAVR